MQEPFDPYVEWLGFMPGRYPTNYYELLGIALFENDPEAIARAADALLLRVRGIQPGEYIDQWQQLLDALTESKRCLLDPASKSTYDASLSGPTPPTLADGTVPAPIVVTPSRRVPVKKYLAAQIAVVVLAAAAVVSGTWLYQLVRQRQPQPAFPGPVASSDGANSPDDLQPGATTPLPSEGHEDAPPNGRAPRSKPEEKPQPEDGPRPAVQPKPEKPPTPETKTEPIEAAPVPPKPKQETPPEPAIDPQKQAAFRRAVTDMRISMAARDLQTARQHLDSAAANTQTPQEKAEINRSDTMLDYLTMFWDGIRQKLASFEGGEEIPIRDTLIIVVEASRDHLIVRAEGRNRRYTVQNLPHVLVMTLAETWFADAPSSKVVIGTYLAVDPEGDRARAQQLWEEARRAGVDVGNILPESDRMPVVAAPSERKPEPAIDQSKLPEAEKIVRELFKSDYKQATTIPRKIELAEKLLATARDTHDDPEGRFVLLREARDLAVACGEATLACEAIDWLAEWYSVDAWEMKTVALKGVARNARGLDGQKDLAVVTLQLTQQAAREKRFEEATRLLDMAQAAARASKNLQLIMQARSVDEELKEMRK